MCKNAMVITFFFWQTRWQKSIAILGNKGNQRLQCNKKMTTSVFCKINQFAISAGLCNNLAGTWKINYIFDQKWKLNVTSKKNLVLWYGKSILLKKSNIFQEYLFHHG